MSNIIPTPTVATPVAPKAAEAPKAIDSKVDFWANAWANRGK